MAALYGTLQGHRGEATRMGTKDSGMSAALQTWGGKARLTLDADGTCELHVSHPTRGGTTKVWSGNIDQIAE